MFLRCLMDFPMCAFILGARDRDSDQPDVLTLVECGRPRGHCAGARRPPRSDFEASR